MSSCQYIDIETKAITSHIPRSIASRVVAAAPELVSGVKPPLGDAFDHWFAAFRAFWRIRFDTLRRAVGKPFSSQGFGKAAFFLKSGQLVRQLFVQHQDKTVAKDQ